MGRIRLDPNALALLSTFEHLTGVKAIDCLQEEDTTTFLVREGDLGLAVGKGGAAIEKVRSKLNRTVWVFESSDDPEKFMRNILKPASVRRITKETDGSFNVELSRHDRGRIMGLGGIRLKVIKELAERHHNIKLNVTSAY
ncbi:NusA-like KH domain protein [uncultured archaeon]|nr:NusA-like KH domain protein [uncultured archaeon]